MAMCSNNRNLEFTKYSEKCKRSEALRLIVYYYTNQLLEEALFISNSQRDKYCFFGHSIGK